MALTEQQEELVRADGSLLALACPGAGKTKTIVARFVRRAAEEPRRGIALVSFTNAAVDEVRARCAANPSALLAPNFIGTFDSFINRYVTTPQYIRRRGKLPRFTEHWGNIPYASFRLQNMGRAPDLALDWFDFDGDGAATLVLERIPQRSANALKDVLTRRSGDVARTAGRIYNLSLARFPGRLWCVTPPRRRRECARTVRG